MKNRRIAIIAFVLVAVMAIGIGYATMNDILNVKGNAEASLDSTTFDAKVYISDAVVTASTIPEGSRPAITKTPSADKDTLTINVPAGYFTKDEDSVEITVTVANENTDIQVWVEDIKFELSDNTPDGDGEGQNKVDDRTYYSITHDVENDWTVTAGGTNTFKITIRLTQTPDWALDCGFDLKLTFTTDAPTP